MKLKNLLLLMTVAALLVAPAGCIFSPDEGGEGGQVDTGLKPAITPAQLMINFETIYTEMIINEFTDMLHEDYLTILMDETIEEWNYEIPSTFNKTEEVRIHSNMFDGKPGMGPDQNIIHPIESIVVSMLDPLNDWKPITGDDEYFAGFDGQWAPYQVLLQFYDADASHKYEVFQEVHFYVAPVEEDGRTIFKMLGQRGLPKQID